MGDSRLLHKSWKLLEIWNDCSTTPDAADICKTNATELGCIISAEGYIVGMCSTHCSTNVKNSSVNKNIIPKYTPQKLTAGTKKKHQYDVWCKSDTCDVTKECSLSGIVTAPLGVHLL